MIQISKYLGLYSIIPQSYVTRFCAYNLLKYQVSINRTIGPLVFLLNLQKAGFLMMWHICCLQVMHERGEEHLKTLTLKTDLNLSLLELEKRWVFIAVRLTLKIFWFAVY